MGELGTNAKKLEERLKEILEVACSWNAVVLIDEADIFLERRTENDIQRYDSIDEIHVIQSRSLSHFRNAMVGIFLRLLEYHQGILFLTTNRVKSFDNAFYSRISIALKYGTRFERLSLTSFSLC